MKVPSVRIVFPIPGKSSVGVEIPNKDRQLVRLRNVMEAGAETAERMQIPLFIGEDVTGDPIIADLAALPHLLIAGRTGTGKSVCLNSIILSILMTKTPAHPTRSDRPEDGRTQSLQTNPAPATPRVDRYETRKPRC